METLTAKDRTAQVRQDPREHDATYGLGWVEAARFLAVAAAAVSVRFSVSRPIPHLNLIGIGAVLVGAWPVFREAARNLAARRMTMELSMSIAILAAAAISEFFTALIITLFVLGAEVLENLTVTRGRRAIRDLLDFLPRLVMVRSAGNICEVGAGELLAGEQVLVSPGGAIPVDGTVTGGRSFVDQSRITGESMPVEKMPGSAVFAGTINQSGALEIHTDRIGRDTSFGKIIEAVEAAERSRAPVQRIADRLAGLLVYFALAAAVLTFLFTRDLRSTISVIIVAGACGIAAGTPLAILGGIGRAARLGAIVKGGLYLEILGRVNTVVLDKTGTLTFGRPVVEATAPFGGASQSELISAAASAESRSEHPLGKAIVAYAAAKGIAVQEPVRFDSRPGLGIAAQVGSTRILAGNRFLMNKHRIPIPEDPGSGTSSDSEVLVAQNGRFLGTITIADTVRPEARHAIKEFDRMGLRTLLLTGDAEPVARQVAAQLGIMDFAAERLPEDKLARISHLKLSGRVVAMVGDGINDAPALAAASVGVAMGSGTDVAQESAGIVLLGNDLRKFADTVEIARWTRRIIWQNFAGTIVVDLAGIALAAAGLLDPSVAAFIHVASEMMFILNSARLFPHPEAMSKQIDRGRYSNDMALSKAA
ncbi:MAG TPA: cation-translocating P-type ATPase [Candidatus Binataceae bacterium]|nr:cation-translocating P-type ATPase [Candidatus Binataceae bacterium]